MHFYGIGYRDLLSLPIRFFWTLHINIDRIQAQKDMRSLSLMNCAFVGGEGAKKYRELLIMELGDVQEVKTDPMKEVLDRAALADLKNSIRKK